MKSDKKQILASDVSKDLCLASTGVRVIDMGIFKVEKTSHTYREVLVPYTEIEMLNRKNLKKQHHHLVIRTEKLKTIEKA